MEIEIKNKLIYPMAVINEPIIIIIIIMFVL